MGFRWLQISVVACPILSTEVRRLVFKAVTLCQYLHTHLGALRLYNYSWVLTLPNQLEHNQKVVKRKPVTVIIISKKSSSITAHLLTILYSW